LSTAAFVPLVDPATGAALGGLTADQRIAGPPQSFLVDTVCAALGLAEAGTERFFKIENLLRVYLSASRVLLAIGLVRAGHRI